MSKTKQLMTFLILCFLIVGCQRTNIAMQGFKYHDNAKRKPIVAILPVVCRVNNYLPWNLSEEFTTEVQRMLLQNAQVYLNTVEMPQKLHQKLLETDSIMLSRNDFSELAGENDFVVVMELIEHNEVPFQKGLENAEILGQNVDRVLNIKMRVKVCDIRSNQAKTILQEIMTMTHLIPHDNNTINYDRVIWGSDPYPATAYGRAHARLEKDLSRQIEKYIVIAH